MMAVRKRPSLKKVIFICATASILTLAFYTDDNIKTLTAADLQVVDTPDIRARKKQFFDFMRPIVISENEKIIKLRKKLFIAKESKHQKKFVTKVAKKYKLDRIESEEDWETLFERVDTIALELVLAQSANESAWGQSRFAQEGNNFFGQWCYLEGCGIVPERRKKNMTYEVARFDSINESVRRYMNNINSSQAYKTLRDIRKKNRAAGKPADAIAQAGGLSKYSERGTAYVENIRSLIRTNEDLIRTNEDLMQADE
ncbi:MAG: glucosaminidase domain-containing protein [Gammaproteobacteria bacterium]|nr:glucosaminidase domain-containing protein [Gammaproteobacteria bacterium]